MKKIVVAALLIAAVAGAAFALWGEDEKTANGSYLRIHIRADSNEPQAQAVKYAVRDRVVEFLTPIVAGCESKEEAMREIGQRLGGIEEAAEAVLRENGFGYGARASLKREEFPTRVYEKVTLGAGVYDALILELGAGKGDNWWCVVYPPLCFTGGNGNVVYRSMIAETIKKFFN